MAARSSPRTAAKELGSRFRAAAHLLVEEAHLLLGGLVGLDQLDGNLIHAVHQRFVHDAKAPLAQPAFPSLCVPTDTDVVSAAALVNS